MDFNNIEQLYAYLESNTQNAKRQSELTRDFKRLADSISDENTIDKIKWEIFAFDFMLIKGDTKPIHSTTREDGKTIHSYPSYSEFGEKGLEYLQERTQAVKNDFLISRYNQILWNSHSKYKHQRQVKACIDAYLRILSGMNCVNEERLAGWDCLSLLENGFCLSLKADYRASEFKQLVKSWLFDRGQFPTDLKIALLKFMMEQPQLKADDYVGCLELIKRIGASHKKKKNDYFLSKDIYSTGLKLAQKLSTDTKIWNKRIGETLIRFAEFRMDDKSRMIPLALYEEAIPYFKLAGRKQKVREVERKYGELKQELKLSKVPIPFLDEEMMGMWDAHLKAKTERILTGNPSQIFDYLLSGEEIFPKKKWLIESVKNNQNSFHDFVATTMKFDIEVV